MRAMIAASPPALADPFLLDDRSAYQRWREAKLERHPRRPEDLVVEVRDPRALRAAELGEIRRVCGLANMAIYSSATAGVADREIARRLGGEFGLARLIANPLADEDGVTSLEAMAEKAGRGYIPYSNRRLLWHTDGYYNAPGETIRAFILHCVRPAAEGGENRLLDPEIAYILLRDADPGHVRALSSPGVLTIPPNVAEGEELRPARTGPVFSVLGGALHMRYTARVRSIEWAPDEATRAAVALLAATLESASPWIFRVRLEAGQGLVCNNVLHDRSAFVDPPAPAAGRLVYRARYAGRIA